MPNATWKKARQLEACRFDRCPRVRRLHHESHRVIILPDAEGERLVHAAPPLAQEQSAKDPRGPRVKERPIAVPACTWRCHIMRLGACLWLAGRNTRLTNPRSRPWTFHRPRAASSLSKGCAEHACRAANLTYTAALRGFRCCRLRIGGRGRQ